LAPASSTLRSSRTVTPAQLARVEQSLRTCTEEVERLKREVDPTVRRMAAMQAEIDVLRARRLQ